MVTVRFLSPACLINRVSVLQRFFGSVYANLRLEDPPAGVVIYPPIIVSSLFVRMLLRDTFPIDSV